MTCCPSSNDADKLTPLLLLPFCEVAIFNFNTVTVVGVPPGNNPTPLVTSVTFSTVDSIEGVFSI